MTSPEKISEIASHIDTNSKKKKKKKMRLIIFWVGVVKCGCGQSDYETLKLTVSQK